MFTFCIDEDVQADNKSLVHFSVIVFNIHVAMQTCTNAKATQWIHTPLRGETRRILVWMHKPGMEERLKTSSRWTMGTQSHVFLRLLPRLERLQSCTRTARVGSEFHPDWSRSCHVTCFVTAPVSETYGFLKVQYSMWVQNGDVKEIVIGYQDGLKTAPV